MELNDDDGGGNDDEPIPEMCVYFYEYMASVHLFWGFYRVHRFIMTAAMAM